MRTSPDAPVGTAKPSLEVADVFRQFGAEYRRHNRLSRQQRIVMRSIEQCRTAALGGHVDQCDHCGALRISYNSCRNRHCPKCGSLSKARWLQARCAELLPIDYFHVVFTTDHAINPIALHNPRQVYDLLFHSAAETLKQFAAKYLGGELGFVAVLHTWGQDLGLHIHLHCIVTGGALAWNGSRWISCRPGFLFPVLALSKVFRDMFCQGLKHLYLCGELLFPGASAQFESHEDFLRLLSQMQSKNWEVYAKEPFAGAEQVLDYLGRYVHRVAISNHRLLSIEDGRVCFHYRDYRDANRPKPMSLKGEEFIRRFLLHVLPHGFMRIRYYGLLHNRRRKSKLMRCRQLLGECAELPPADYEPYDLLFERLTGIDIRRCPVCGSGRMLRQQILPPIRLISPEHVPRMAPFPIEASI